MSQPEDKNSTEDETYNPITLQHVDSLEVMNINETLEEEPRLFPHVDSMILMGAIVIDGAEGSINGDDANPAPGQNSDSAG